MTGRPDRLAYAGIALTGICIALAALSRRFAYDRPVADRPVILLPALLVAAGVIYLAAVWPRPDRMRGGRTMLAWIVGVGLAMRLAMWFSAPMMEDDWYRYLWDGAVTAEGLDPYEYSPRQVRLGVVTDSAAAGRYAELAAGGETVLARVNHPHLATIYPPVAQAAFAAAHRIAPWSLHGWRAVVLAADVAGLLLLAGLLRRLDLPLWLMAVYWWNPLAVKEFYNSAHMDVLLVPLALGALLAAVRGRTVLSALALGLAAGTKVWPVILLPLILRSSGGTLRRKVSSAAVFAVVCAAVYLPLADEIRASASGFGAYFGYWEMNDALFMVILWPFEALFESARSAQTAARLAAGGMLTVYVAWLCRRPWDDPRDLARRCLFAVAAMFLLSPTQFPWYFTWLLPLLALVPVRGLLLLTAALPLYYLRFWFDSRGMAGYFDNGLVWVEYIPVWLLLGLDWLDARRGAGEGAT